jgi:hypothetical protein
MFLRIPLKALRLTQKTSQKRLSKKMFRIFKKEKCLDSGVSIGGNHMDEYMPQFINFFKTNLL